MRTSNASLLQCVLVAEVLFASPIQGIAKPTTGPDQSGDPSWPRELYQNGTRLIIYQPQVDDWKNFQDLSLRMAVSLTRKGGKEVIGVADNFYSATNQETK